MIPKECKRLAEVDFPIRGIPRRFISFWLWGLSSAPDDLKGVVGKAHERIRERV